MRDYGKVHSTFWSSPTIAPLSDDAKLLALYLLSCTHSTIAGVFRLPDGYVAEDLRWEPPRVTEGFAELLANGFARRCESTKWVWVVKHLEWNPPDNPNQRKAAAKVAQAVPEDCSWRAAFVADCGPALGLDANPSRTIPKPFANQKQNQNQNQEHKHEQEQELQQAQQRASAASPLDSPSASDVQSNPNGSRLLADWSVPADWRQWARENRPDIDVEKVAEMFVDHWHGKPGTEGQKSDWKATWRKWVRREKQPAVARHATSATAVLHADDNLQDMSR